MIPIRANSMLKLPKEFGAILASFVSRAFFSSLLHHPHRHHSH
jgi:hypothetical protein